MGSTPAITSTVDSVLVILRAGTSSMLDIRFAYFSICSFLAKNVFFVQKIECVIAIKIFQEFA